MFDDKTFLNIANSLSVLSLCTRTRIACIIVKDGKIISYGYNGNGKCTYENCYRTKKQSNNAENENYCIGVHAEWRALIQGTNFNDAVMYCTMKPCSVCAKMIVESGIKKIVYEMDYIDQFNSSILKDIELVHIPYTSKVKYIISELSKMSDEEQKEIGYNLGNLIKQAKYDY